MPRRLFGLANALPCVDRREESLPRLNVAQKLFGELRKQAVVCRVIE
jgi:hypothetical protein